MTRYILPTTSACPATKRVTGSVAVTKTIEAEVAAVAELEVVAQILEVVCRTTGMGFAAVARVTEDRWMACAVRDEIRSASSPAASSRWRPRSVNEIRDNRQLVVIDHVARDQAFCRHQTPAKYGLQSYISVPIILPDGAFFGTLCAIDPRPARLDTPETIGMFSLFADLIGLHLDAQGSTRKQRGGVGDERQQSEFREQFIAVLGHDLRNPLAAIAPGSTCWAANPSAARVR